MNTILSRYVMKSALLAMLGAVLGLWLLQLVFAYLSELENLSETYTFADALAFIGYRSPYFLVQFIPTGTLLGAVVGLGLLAGNSELVVMRAAGLSVYRIIGWIMIPAFLFVLLSLGVNQYILPGTSQKAASIARQTPAEDTITLKGYWSLSQKDISQEIVYISYADDHGRLGQLTRFNLTDGVLTDALRATGGVYSTGTGDGYEWRLTDVAHVHIASAVTQNVNQDQTLTLPIAPDDVHLLTDDAQELSLTDLIAHKRLMTHQGRTSLPHELAFWQKLFSPFAVLSLVLLASSFVFGSLRSQGLGLRIVLALLVGLLFSYLTDLTGFVSLATGISPLLMAILPIVISAVFGVYLLEKRH